MFLWGSHCSRSAGHSGALGSATPTAILSASGHWEIESCEFVFVTMCCKCFQISKLTAVLLYILQNLLSIVALSISSSNIIF